MNLINGLEIGISPSSLKVDMGVNELTCKNLTIYSSSNSIFFNLYDLWSDSDDRNINDYYKKYSGLNLYLEYPNQLEVDKNEEVEICFKSEKAGKYNGLLVFETENEVINIGVWLDINSYSQESDDKSILKNEDFNEGKILNLFLVMNSLLIAFLGYFVVISLRKTNGIEYIGNMDSTY